MNSPFQLKNQSLSLARFPASLNEKNLQAWDAADEYLIHYLTDQNLLNNGSNENNNKNTTILIFNDTFGALSLSCSLHNVFCVNDSYISQQGIRHNKQQNTITQNNSINLLNSLEALPNNVDIVLYKIPKSKALLIEQLININAIITEKILFIAAAKAKAIHSSTLKLFEKYIGETKTSLAIKKARLVFCQPDAKLKFSSPFPTIWPLENTTFTLLNHANVFAREKLDLGARFFMQHLPLTRDHNNVIDLGCGNGVIGLTLLAQSLIKEVVIKLTFIDESYMAIASAKSNIKNNLPTLIANCQFFSDDSLTNSEDDSADLILCNPPFHQLQTITDHIAWQMFNDSYRVLKKGGELRIIGNRQLGYHVKLAKIFSRTTLIANNNKFVIISAIK